MLQTFPLVLLLAVACVSVQAPTPTESPQLTPQVTPANTTDPPPVDTQPPDPDTIETFLAWIVGLGPGSPEGPTQVDLYQLIEQATQNSCRQVLDPDLDDEQTRVLYHGAAAACLAALHGKTSRWTEAEAAFSSLPGRPAGCVDQATYDLLESILVAYHADPEVIFTRQGEPPEGKPDTVRLPCPRISDVSVTRSPDALVIEVRGNRLGQVLEVSYASVDNCPQPTDMESDLRLEPDGDANSLQATVTGDDEALAATMLWVGLIAEPFDWVAASDCVPIQDAPSSDI